MEIQVTDNSMHYSCQSSSMGDTEALAFHLSKELPRKFLLYLQGGLGVGKTTFVRSLLTAVGVIEPVNSPSFAMVENYETANLKIAHLDFYRCSNMNEWIESGLAEDIEASSLVVVEWPENALGLPKPDLQVLITEGAKSQERLFEFTALTSKGKKVLTQLSL